jgi:hypothetical protein
MKTRQPRSGTFWKTDGAEFTINLQSIKGIDKAIAAVPLKALC